MKTRLLTLVGITIWLSFTLVPAHSADLSQVKIPFPFMVGNTLLPPGEYNLIQTSEELAIRVVGKTTTASSEAIVVTRLAGGIHTTPKDAHIVFDKVGDTYILSELWLPGEDGFLLHVTNEKHAHKIVNSPS